MNFTKNFLKISLFSLTSIIVFNFFVDSVGRYYNSKINSKKIIKFLKFNKEVSSIRTINSFSYKNYLIDITDGPINTVICGTSRSEVIGKEVFEENMDYINVSGAGFSLMDILVLCEKSINKFSPKIIIFSIDPKMFYQVMNSREWIRLNKSNFFDQFKQNYNLDINFFEIYQFYKEYFFNLINFDILKKNISYLLKLLKYKKNFFVNEYEIKKLEKLGIFDDRFLKNGSDINTFKSLYDDENLMRQIGINESKINYDFQPIKLNIFDNFLNLHKKNKEIHLLFVPLHPIYKEETEEKIKNDYIESLVKNLKNSHKNIKLKGSFNLYETKCIKTEMLDTMHVNENCLKKILDLN